MTLVLSPEELGGVEYRALRVLLKVITGEFNRTVQLSYAYKSRICCRSASVWCRVSCALDLQRKSETSGLPCFHWPKQGVVVCVFLKP
jgi:hypothetical protein